MPACAEHGSGVLKRVERQARLAPHAMKKTRPKWPGCSVRG